MRILIILVIVVMTLISGYQFSLVFLYADKYADKTGSFFYQEKTEQAEKFYNNILKSSKGGPFVIALKNKSELFSLC